MKEEQVYVTYDVIVGTVVRRLRKDLKITQVKAAKHLGTSQSGFSRMETGVMSLTVLQLWKICTMCKTEPSEFYRRVEYVKTICEMKNVAVTESGDNGLDVDGLIELLTSY